MSRRSVPFIGASNGSFARAAERGFAVLRVFAGARTFLRFTGRVLPARERFVDFAIVVTLRTRRLARSDDELKHHEETLGERVNARVNWPTIWPSRSGARRALRHPRFVLVQ